MPIPISQLVNDRPYMKVVKAMRSPGPNGRTRCASIRRRSLIATLHRWHQDRQYGPITFVEVGVKYGGLSSEILTWCDFIEYLYAVDPYEEYPQDHPDRGQFGYAGRTQPAWDHVYRRAQAILGKHPGRFEIWRTYSVLAASRMADEGLRPDVVYLDARHSYPDVLEDCREWWPVVLPGGLLCGDDYYGPVEAAPGNWRRNTTGVSQAADDFAAEVGCSLFGQHRTWYVEKPS